MQKPKSHRLGLGALAFCALLGLTACNATGAPGRGPVSGPAPGPVSGPVSGAVIEVYKSDGSRQCETESGVSPQTMQARELADVQVLSARRDALRDMAFPAVCGGMTGSVNVFTIPAADWEKVHARGFARWQ